MARGGRSRQRDRSPIASENELLPSELQDFYSSSSLLLSLLEDRRTFHPDPIRPPRSFLNSDVRLVASRARARRLAPSSWQPAGVRFAVPARVWMCVRRKRRREVIFAKRLMRRGAGSGRRRSFWSDVFCR